MPQIRPEQIASYGINDLQIAVNAAIKQSKIADQIADTNGWISKGTINPVSSFSGSTAGYQEFGLDTLSDADSGLSDNTIYYFEVNGKEYSIDTTGQATPISFQTVVDLMEAQVSGDNLSVVFTDGDIRIISTVSGYDQNVFINPNCTRHRLHDYLSGFTAFDDPVRGSGITWDGSQAGRLFFAEDTNEIRIGISTDPYYQTLGFEGSESKITVVDGPNAVDWDGTNGSIFRSDYGFESDASNLFVYLNGQLLEYGAGGTNDYQILVGAGENGQYTDVSLNENLPVGVDDKVTMIVYQANEASAYATKAYVNDKLSDNVSLDGDTTIDGNIIPGQNAIHTIGLEDNTWKSIYLNDSIYFKPIGTNDTLRIYRDVNVDDTQLKFQIGTSADDKVVFEDENNTVIMAIDGDGGVTIPGNLTVQGTTTYANEENTTISDSDFVIKDTATPEDGDATYSVERANGNVSLKWNDSTDRWQLIYGTTANITSNILTENDLDDGLLLDNRYVQTSKIVTAGDIETNGVIQYAGVQDTVAPDGVFYAGTIKPDSNTRLNYGGDLYVKSLYADDVYVSANSLYIDGKKAIENDTDVMTFRGDTDQAISLKTLGTGDVNIESGDLLSLTSVGDLTLTVDSTYADKNINIVNNSSGGVINFTGLVSIGNSGTFEDNQSAPTGEQVLGYNGYFYATKVYNAVYNDLAEFMPKAEDCEPGQVLVQTSEGVKPCSLRGDGAVVGVYSDSYGYALGGDENKEGVVPIGISGRVWVWIEEPCKIGDLLITSDKLGFATVKKDDESGIGKVFGKVMKEKTDSIPERIEVLILMS